MRSAISLGAALDEHDELVAAEPADRVALAQDAGEPGGDAAQQLVAGGVAEGVVDVLEAVEVDEQRRRLDAVRGGRGRASARRGPGSARGSGAR